MEIFTYVPGENRGRIVLYALSTCIWCRKTKKLLNELGVAYYYVNVDELTGDAQTQTETEILQWNPKVSFPTLILNGQKSIVGYDEKAIREELGHG